MELKTKNQKGQVMLLTVLFLSAVFLSATIVAGVLMVLQISQAAKITDSAQAIFAADAAIERALFRVYRCNDANAPGQPNIAGGTVCNNAGEEYAPDAAGNLPEFFNVSAYQLLIATDQQCANHDSGADPTNVVCIKAVGSAGKSARAFSIEF